MNNIDFLKNGSTINIKKKNKGKFTSYCGGNVTSKCIEKGKHSSNPEIRKRAVFAENARRWKHKNGGAFVEGVNILDSNPSMYKYIKRKIKMNQEGAKFDWSGFATLGLLMLPGIISSIKQNSALNKQKEQNKALKKLQDSQDKLYALLLANYYVDLLRLLLQDAFNSGKSNELWSDIVGGYMQNKISDLLVKLKLNLNQTLLDQNNAYVDLLIENNRSEVFGSLGSFLNTGINMYKDYIQKKNAAPSNTTSNLDFKTNWNSGLNYKPDYSTFKTNWNSGLNYKNPNAF